MAVVFACLSGDLIAASLVLIALCVFYVRQKLSYWQRRGFASIEPQFPFGNFKEMFLLRKSASDLTTDLYRSSDAPVVGIWTMLRPTLLIRDPAAIRSILIGDFAKFQDRGIYCDAERDPLSGHLVALPGEKWRHLRQKLSPTFTSGKLRAMFSTLVGCGQPLVQHMDQQANGDSVVEIRELLAQFTTNIIASVAFGLEIDCIANPDTEFRRFGRQALAPTIRNGLRGAIQIFFPSVMRMLNLRLVDREVEDFFMSVVRQNMNLREKGNVTRKDFFQLLVQLRNNGLQEDGVWETKITSEKEEMKNLTIEQCAAQSFVFYLAGFETSATTSSFALYELAKTPECQRRVQTEIDEVLRRHGGEEVTYESVAEMKYLDACIDETLRMHPPIPVLNRTCSVPWTVPNTGGQTIEAGTPIIIPTYALHYDPQYYPNPEQFDPERFSVEQLAGQSSGQRPYLPFGDGPRNCIGLRLGKIQTKVALITMLQRYSFELAGNTKLPLTMEASSFILNPVGGINLRVSHRK